jgi:hypothetical protein
LEQPHAKEIIYLANMLYAGVHIGNVQCSPLGIGKHQYEKINRNYQDVKVTDKKSANDLEIKKPKSKALKKRRWRNWLYQLLILEKRILHGVK